jgi:hypothetical protein
MTRRRPIDNRQEPEFGYTRRVEPYFDEPRASPSQRAMRSRSRRRSLLPVFLVGAVIILFGGFLWLSYVKGPKTGAGQLPVITADTTPVKVKPDNPGGADIPFQDTTVYDDLNQGKQKHPQPEVEHLLQPPEQPLPMPTPAADGTAVAEPPPAAAVEPAPPSAPAAASKEDTAPAITSDNEAVLAPQPAPVPAPAPVAKLPPPPADSALPSPVVPVVKPTAKASAEATPARPKATGIKNSLVQLGSFKDDDAAKTEWQRLKTRYSDQLGSLAPTYQRVDLGEKGIWYRLRAGPLSADKAKAICVALTNAKAPCIVSTH